MFRPAVIHWTMAALRPHVLHVVGAGPQEKMIGVDARSNVTLVKNVKAARDWAIARFPRHPMCLAVRVKLPITKIREPADPYVATTLRYRHRTFLQARGRRL